MGKFSVAPTVEVCEMKTVRQNAIEQLPAAPPLVQAPSSEIIRVEFILL